MNAKTKKALDMLQAEYGEQKIEDGEFTSEMFAEKIGCSIDKARRLLRNRQDVSGRKISMNGSSYVIWRLK